MNSTSGTTTHERNFRISNPTRWLQARIRRTANDVGEAGRRLKDAAMNARKEIERAVAQAPPLAIEIVTALLRQLILTAVELGIGRLVRRLTSRPKPTLVIPFPTPASAV